VWKRTPAGAEESFETLRSRLLDNVLFLMAVGDDGL
jgi:hypothetical protein